MRRGAAAKTRRVLALESEAANMADRLHVLDAEVLVVLVVAWGGCSAWEGEDGRAFGAS